MKNNILNKNCILIVDDDFINRELLKNIFSSQYTFEEAENGQDGLLQIEKYRNKLCAIILDVQMPEMNGIELLKRIAKKGVTEEIPTFLITAQDDDELVAEAYNLGVVDVVSKPVTPIVIQKRVKTVIELFSARAELSEKVRGQEKELIENAKAIDDLNRSTIEALATAIEFRDMESGHHVSRIYGITKYLLTYTSFGEGLSHEDIESIARAAIMHDVGKISISDVILNKPGKLTKEEFEIMKSHTVKGFDLLEQICRSQTNGTYRYAKDIARHHHERWDGRGYPDGLSGDEISVAAQVVSIADVYDALVSDRVYKKAFTPDVAVNMIKNGECGVFNPVLLECFLEAEPTIRDWYMSDDPNVMPEELAEDARRINAVYNQVSGTVSGNAPSSVTDVMLLTTAVHSAYDMIISVNLTQNVYSMMDFERFGTQSIGKSGVFDEMIEAATATIPISHRHEFHDIFCREGLLKAYRDGKRMVRYEHPQYSDDGTLHWVSDRVLFMVDGRTGDLLEITMSQYIDAEIAERRKTRKILSDALTLSEQANNAKYSFLSRMSHDIRTPMNAIIGMTTVIAANLDNKDKINECLVKIGTSSRHLLGIINEMLDYTKIESGNLSLHMSDFNIVDLLADVSLEASEKAKKKNQKLTCSIDEDTATAYIGDVYRIRQILAHLLDNAHKYTPDGGEYSIKVDVSHRANDHDVLSFKVEDNGRGISPEYLTHIFEPFSLDPSLDMTQSIGLGLSISQNLAHLMNGSIGVISELGVGTTFTFELPLERGDLTAYSETVDTDINVLVVDDDITMCEHTSTLLQNMGISAEIADNGQDAIRLVKLNAGTDKEFDVAIIDWQMPGMDGVETVRGIRQIVGNDVLVVIMSAYDWSEIEAEARESGVDLFISKPISESDLFTAIACSDRIRREHQSVSFNGEKVLVVEDNEFNAEIAKAILEMNNLHVDLAFDGKEAYEKFIASDEGEYLAVLMDIMMPVMGGHETAKAIRASKHPEAGGIPIYAMTANAFRNDILEAKLAGMNGHIAKPVDFDDVCHILYDIVKQKNK